MVGKTPVSGCKLTPLRRAVLLEVDAPFEQQVLDLPQLQRIPDVHHHRQADDLGGTVEITERISHRQRLRARPVSLKPIWSDTALSEAHPGATTRRYRSGKSAGFVRRSQNSGRRHAPRAQTGSARCLAASPACPGCSRGLTDCRPHVRARQDQRSKRSA